MVRLVKIIGSGEPRESAGGGDAEGKTPSEQAIIPRIRRVGAEQTPHAEVCPTPSLRISSPYPLDHSQ